MADVIAETAVDVCELWLERCREALRACESEPITAAFVAAGAVAWDECCGTLIAAPERIYRTADFPNEGQSADFCETGSLVVNVLILLLRCVPSVDDRGNPPTADALNASYQRAIRDGAIVWDAVTGDLPEGWERANVSQTFTPDEGGCIGVETRFTIGLPQEGWCPCPE
jgi:hypothetical protein